jgi:hypothetical protein
MSRDFSVPTWYTLIIEFKPSLTTQKSLEDILKENIETVEQSILESDSKLELVLSLLDKKQGVPS